MWSTKNTLASDSLRMEMTSETVCGVCMNCEMECKPKNERENARAMIYFANIFFPSWTSCSVLSDAVCVVSSGYMCAERQQINSVLMVKTLQIIQFDSAMPCHGMDRMRKTFHFLSLSCSVGRSVFVAFDRLYRFILFYVIYFAHSITISANSAAASSENEWCSSNETCIRCM